jgi:hypothetical protein
VAATILDRRKSRVLDVQPEIPRVVVFLTIFGEWYRSVRALPLIQTHANHGMEYQMLHESADHGSHQAAAHETYQYRGPVGGHRLPPSPVIRSQLPQHGLWDGRLRDYFGQKVLPAGIHAQTAARRLFLMTQRRPPDNRGL